MKSHSKQCFFCTSNIRALDYKETENLRRFLDPLFRILPKRRSGLCAGHQREFGRNVKKARALGLLPYRPLAK